MECRRRARQLHLTLTILAGVIVAAASSSSPSELVSVAIDESIPPHLCARTLDNLEALLTSTSLALFNEFPAAALAEVSVRLPPSWSRGGVAADCLASRRGSVGQTEAASRGDRGHDIVVTADRNPLFGSRPVAKQFGRCGERGLRLELPSAGLTANVSLAPGLDLALAREWVKYRFGVFEETGFEGDRLYPLHYSEGEEIKTNVGCSNHTEDSIVCPAEHYNSDATTKQNMLCDGLSARKVIEQALMTNANLSSDAFEPPRFSFSLPSRPQLFVLALDRSAVAGSNFDRTVTTPFRRWESLRSSLFRFIARLPVDSRLAIISYGGRSGGAVVNLPPTAVTAANRAGLHGRIPRRPTDLDASAATDETCLDCALKAAFKLMRKSRDDTSVEGTLVIATGAAMGNGVSEKSFRTVRENRLPVYSVALSGSGGSKKDLTAAPLTEFGSSFVIPTGQEVSGPEYSTHLALALSAILRETSSAKLSSSLLDRRLPNVDNLLSGTFVVEEHQRRNVWVVATAEDERDVESFEVLSPSGERHAFPTYRHGLAYFALPGLSEPGIWSYNVKLYQTLASHYPVHLEVVAEPSSEEEAVALRSWRAAGDSHEIYIYAELRQGSLPVLDASVIATVHRPGGDSVEIELRDLGTGYPDVTAGDGVYSSYFTDLSPRSGAYQVTVHATHNDGKARTPKLAASLNADDNVCCGSAAPVSYTVPTGPFTRHIAGPSFHVEQAANFYIRQGGGSGLVNDVFPPSRITDFTVDNYLEESLFVTLRWTAPGGDFDRGKAFRYEIRCYTNRAALRDENFADMSIPVHTTLVPAPEEQGTEQRCTVGVPWPNEVFYYAIVAFDEAGNRGRISNTIAVHIKEEQPSTASSLFNEVEVDGPEAVRRRDEAGIATNHLNIVVTAACVTSALLVILIALAVMAVRRRLAKNAGANTSAASDEDGCSYEGDDESKLASTLKRIIPASVGVSANVNLWKPDDADDAKKPGGCSPTSDYSSQRSGSLPSTISWHQKATSQAACCGQSAVTSVYSGAEDDCQLAPRISVMEDYSVYRDLSNLSHCGGDYVSFSQLPDELRKFVTALPPPPPPPTYLHDMSERHESLV